MNRLLLPAAALLGGAVLLAHPRASTACSCSGIDPLGAFLEADVVFTGTMAWSSDPRADEPSKSSGDPISYHFLVGRAFKGDPAESLLVVSARFGASCGYAFTPGEAYLVYAWERNDTLHTGLCTRNAPLDRAGEDLAFLATVPNGPVAAVNSALAASARDSLDDPNPEARARSLRVYQAVAETTAVDRALLAGLHDPSLRVRLTALDGWGTRIRRGGAPLAPVLPLVDDPERLLRLEAIGVLAGAADKADSAVAVLAPVSRDPDPEVRGRVAKILGILSGKIPSARRALLAMWETDPTSRVRATVLRWIPMESPLAGETVRRLQAAARDTSAEVRAAAASVLAYRGAEDQPWSGRLRVELLGDPDPRVRDSAGLSLSTWGVDLWRRVPFDSMLPVLSEAVKDTEYSVRSGAFAVLAQSGSRRAVPVLVGALDDPRVPVQWDALRALGELGPVAVVAVPRLREFEAMSYGNTKAMVAATLRKIQDPGRGDGDGAARD